MTPTPDFWSTPVRTPPEFTRPHRLWRPALHATGKPLRHHRRNRQLEAIHRTRDHRHCQRRRRLFQPHLAVTIGSITSVIAGPYALHVLEQQLSQQLRRVNYGLTLPADGGQPFLSRPPLSARPGSSSLVDAHHGSPNGRYVNLATPGFSKMPGERRARSLAASPPTAPGGRAGDGTYLARWAAYIGLGEQVMATKTLRRRFFSLTGRVTRKARRLTLHLPQGWPWQNQFSSALARLRVLPLPS